MSVSRIQVCPTKASLDSQGVTLLDAVYEVDKLSIGAVEGDCVGHEVSPLGLLVLSVNGEIMGYTLAYVNTKT